MSLGRIVLAGLSWTLPQELDDDAALKRLLFPDEHQPVSIRTEPEWVHYVADSGHADRLFRPMPITRSGQGDHPGRSAAG